jgi:hypothetical protein
MNSGGHLASYKMDTGGSFLKSKAAGAFDHSPPSSIMVKNMWSYTLTHPYLVKCRDNFTLYLNENCLGKLQQITIIYMKFVSDLCKNYGSRTSKDK